MGISRAIFYCFRQVSTLGHRQKRNICEKKFFFVFYFFNFPTSFLKKWWNAIKEAIKNELVTFIFVELWLDDKFIICFKIRFAIKTIRNKTMINTDKIVVQIK